MTLEQPIDHTLAGLHRILADDATAVQLVDHYTPHDGTHHDTYGWMHVGVNYWPYRVQDASILRFSNTLERIALMWPTSWTYEWENDDHEAILAHRQNRPDGNRLTLRLHQPERLADAWSASLTPDRIESE